MMNDRRIPTEPRAYYISHRGKEIINGFKCPRCRSVVWSFNTGEKFDRCRDCGQAIDYTALNTWKD